MIYNWEKVKKKYQAPKSQQILEQHSNLNFVLELNKTIAFLSCP